MEPIRDTTQVRTGHRAFLEYYDLSDPRDTYAIAEDVSANAWLATSDLFIARMYHPN